LPFIIAGIVDATGAQAASLRVGDTVQIVHDVEGRQSNDQSWGSKAEGDNIYENEFIRTKVESQARLLLVDRTGLAVGPITTIRIDRMVYSPDQSIKGVVVSAGAGTVRWTSGDSSSYLIRTPTADVTPMGTVFDLFVDSQRTFVILRQGRAKVCTNNLQPKCKNLDNAGEMMLATADELQGPWRSALDPSDFANRCLSANGQNCVINMNYSPPRQAPPREPPVTRTRRADVQPSRSRVVEEEYVVPPRRRMGYPTYYPRPYPRVVFGTVGAGYPRPYPTRWYPRPYPRTPVLTGQMYPRRPFYPRRPMNPTGSSAYYVR
jgi:FecR-like protein